MNNNQNSSLFSKYYYSSGMQAFATVSPALVISPLCYSKPSQTGEEVHSKELSSTWGCQNPLMILGALAKIRRPICRECWASAWQKIKSQKVSEMLNNGLQLFHISHYEKILARDDSEVFHSHSGHCGKCDKEQAFSLLLSGLLKTVINCCLW